MSGFDSRWALMYSACGRDGKSTCFGSTKMLVRLQPRRLIIAVDPVLVGVGGCYPPRRRFDSCRRSFVPLAERQRCQASNLARRVRFPQGTLGDRLKRERRAFDTVV